MGQSLSKVYVHITFSTKNRQPIIDAEIEKPLYDYMGGICKGLECNPVRIGGYSDHIHILCILSKKITQMKLLEELKKQSSIWIKSKGVKYHDFYWQDGYGIFSVNPSEVELVMNYIDDQKEHHSKKSFKDELRAFLRKYNVDFDERYIWN
ncbi:IS200/IS605 family transposase [Marinifilum flexuosum]|uniref:IS200/IS605 family transposase n=1 Tax=Marinifilum flexuosum TaxID=1117708 RepID=UPI00249490F6|nr:IS200/IS605 family transposase [Marinifilum flexuosum]